MTPEETAALLMWAAGHDRRHEVGSKEEAQIRRRIWAGVLQEVPFDFARNFVDRHYAKVDAPEVKPAHILWAYRTDKRVAEAREHAVIPGLPSVLSSRRPEWFNSYFHAVEAVRVQGGDPDGVPLPFTRIGVDDSRERRCREHETCICTHSECRDGWLDVEGSVSTQNGTRYPAAKRCPVCLEAVEMKAELTPRRGRR